MSLMLGSSPIKKIIHIHGSGAFAFNAEDPNVAMSFEHAHQRLGIAEGVIHELQIQLQLVFAGHQAMHQELSNLRGQVDTRSRIRLVEPKTLMPDRFGKKNGRVGELGRTWQGTSLAWCTWYCNRR